MSSLRLCGLLAKRSIFVQSKQLPLLVPVIKSSHELISSSVNKQQYREYKNFGHKPTPVPRISQYFHFFIGLGIFICVLDWKW